MKFQLNLFENIPDIKLMDTTFFNLSLLIK